MKRDKCRDLRERQRETYIYICIQRERQICREIKKIDIERYMKRATHLTSGAKGCGGQAQDYGDEPPFGLLRPVKPSVPYLQTR